jgi:hypothetical protein
MFTRLLGNSSFHCLSINLLINHLNKLGEQHFKFHSLRYWPKLATVYDVEVNYELMFSFCVEAEHVWNRHYHGIDCLDLTSLLRD